MQPKETGNEWNGVAGSTEHRTTTYRAWCFQDACWCTPDAWCECCHVAASHWQVWLPDKNSDEYVQLALEIHQKIDIASDRGPVLEVLDALWEMRD